MTVTVTAVPVANVVPTVNAGANNTVQVNQSVSITGTATDSDGTISSYEWKKGSSTLGTTATLSYTPTVVGTDTLTLEVTDNDGAKSTDTMTVMVTAVPVVSGKTTRCLYGRASNLYEASSVIKNDSSADLIENCGFGLMCNEDPLVNNGEAYCGRSVDNTTSPYEDFSCSFSEFMRHPTTLEVDCRCRIIGDGSGGAGGTGTAYADPTNIDITQGARPGGGIINCAPAGRQISDTWPVIYGQGPKFDAWYKQNRSGASWFGGVFNPTTRELFGLVKWTNPNYSKSATIVAWNIDTKDRRVVSGLYPDVTEATGQRSYGSGYLAPAPVPKTTTQPLTGANSIKLGSDGMLYVYGGGTGEGAGSQRQITKVNPTTGERTLIWKAMNKKYTGDISATYGQCFRPDVIKPNTTSVGLQAQAFSVGPNLEFYLSMHDTRAGDGILKISANGRTCTPVSVWTSGTGTGHNPGGGQGSAPAYTQIGAGVNNLQFPIHGMLYYNDPTDGPVIFGEENGELISFKVSNGFRKLVSDHTTTFGGMGFGNMFFENRDGHRLVWAVGTIARFTGATVDLDNGHRESVFGDSTDYAEPLFRSVYAGEHSVSTATMLANNHYIGYGAFMIDPNDNRYAYFVLKHGALGKMELSTFNNYVYSY
jgi:hypothetical protein